jgi:hypothetical protein
MDSRGRPFQRHTALHPEILMSDDHLQGPGPTILTPIQRINPPATPAQPQHIRSSSTPPGQTTFLFSQNNPATVRQKKGKRVRGGNHDASEGDRDIASSIADSDISHMEELLENPTPRGNQHTRHPLQPAFETGSQTPSNLTLTLQRMQTDMANMAATMNTILATNATIRDQNTRLEQRTMRMEQQIQTLKRNQTTERQQPQAGTTQQRGREKTPAPTTRKPVTTQATPPTTTPNAPRNQQADEGTTWATVAKKAKPQKESGPPKRSERTIIIHRNADAKNEQADIFEMRKTINMYLTTQKAPSNFRIAGIQWNRRGNLTLTTTGTFTEEELSKYQTTIEEQVKKFDQEITSVSKQETWTKLIVHGVDLNQFPDTDIGMADLKLELETFNDGLRLAANPRYLTRPDKRINKEHSSCVIALKDKEKSKVYLKHGVTIFGQHRKTAEYFSARPTDQCSKCQGFGHHWQRCTGTQKCGICASTFHDTRSHACPNCNSKSPCEHLPAKCANCLGPHKSNSNECETLKALRNPHEDRTMEEQL